MKFYDRTEEINLIKDAEERSRENAVFMVLMGRRRVGKTSLIIHSLEGMDYAYLFVSKDNEAMLCAKFQEALETQLGVHIYGNVTHFRDLFEVIMKESQNRHFTVVFDEFQTLYKINPAIFSEIQDLWDRYHTTSKLNLIVSGSVNTLMKRIFENESEPLYGRPTNKFMLRPFRISVLKQILHDSCPSYKPEDLLCLYLITGGVAKYVELFIDAKCFTKEKMIDYICRQDSYFITEGKDLLNNEFSGDFITYFSIMQLIASGMTRRSEIDGALQKSMGVYLQNLEKNYEMISRIKPLMTENNGKISSYEICDNFMRFWFRFIYPYQSLIERNLYDLLKNNIVSNYERFSGRTLELYFQDKIMETGQYTQIGNWWNRTGENEIDLVAINEFDHTGVIAEVKRNPEKINLAELQEKASRLPKKEFGKYKFSIIGLSLESL